MNYPTHKITLTVVDDGASHWDLWPVATRNCLQSVFKDDPAIISVEEGPLQPGEKVRYKRGSGDWFTVVAVNGDMAWLTYPRGGLADRLEKIELVERVEP